MQCINVALIRLTVTANEAVPYSHSTPLLLHGEGVNAL